MKEKIFAGLKLWSSFGNLIEEAICLIENKTFQYIELTPIPGSNLEIFYSAPVPFIIHLPTEKQGFNIGDSSCLEFNTSIIQCGLDLADDLKAPHVILHPGYGNPSHAIDFLENNYDKRILIENMPMVGINNESMIGFSPSTIKELMECAKYGLCLDFNHAIKASISLKTDYKDFIKKFLEIDPAMFHLSDGTLTDERDKHLALGDGDYDIGFLKKCIEQSGLKPVTFETPRLSDSFSDDIRNLNHYLRI